MAGVSFGAVIIDRHVGWYIIGKQVSNQACKKASKQASKWSWK